MLGAKPLVFYNSLDVSVVRVVELIFKLLYVYELCYIKLCHPCFTNLYVPFLYLFIKKHKEELKKVYRQINKIKG